MTIEDRIESAKISTRYFIERYSSSDGEHWITVHPKGVQDGEGIHVKVNSDGKIEKKSSEHEKPVIQKDEKAVSPPVSSSEHKHEEKKMDVDSKSDKTSVDVGKRAHEVGNRTREITPTKVRVQHAKGYSGKLGNKSYFAKINGFDDKYGFDRDFQEPDDTDWGDSQLFKKSKGTFHNIHNVSGEGGVFEHNEHGDKDFRIYFPGLKEGSPTLFRKTITGDELKQSLKLLKNSGMDAGDLPKALTDSQGSEEPLVERVRRWTRGHSDKAVAEDFEGDVDAMKEALNDHESGTSSDWKVKEQAGYRAAIQRAIMAAQRSVDQE